MLSDTIQRPATAAVFGVSMHLLVLSAFRQTKNLTSSWKIYVSMHLLVLSAFRQDDELPDGSYISSQCTFWCSVLSDRVLRRAAAALVDVSMHLLVLSAFRPIEAFKMINEGLRLNAPFGAQCFPTDQAGD